MLNELRLVNVFLCQHETGALCETLRLLTTVIDHSGQLVGSLDESRVPLKIVRNAISVQVVQRVINDLAKRSFVVAGIDASIDLGSGSSFEETLLV